MPAVRQPWRAMSGSSPYLRDGLRNQRRASAFSDRAIAMFASAPGPVPDPGRRYPVHPRPVAPRLQPVHLLHEQRPEPIAGQPRRGAAGSAARASSAVGGRRAPRAAGPRRLKPGGGVVRAGKLRPDARGRPRIVHQPRQPPMQPPSLAGKHECVGRAHQWMGHLNCSVDNGHKVVAGNPPRRSR